MSKASPLGAALRQAAAEREKQLSNHDSMIAGNQDSNEEQAVKTEDTVVGLNVRVPKKHRLHWLIEAKKQDTSLQAAVIEALNARFGEPVD